MILKDFLTLITKMKTKFFLHVQFSRKIYTKCTKCTKCREIVPYMDRTRFRSNCHVSIAWGELSQNMWVSCWQGPWFSRYCYPKLLLKIHWKCYLKFNLKFLKNLTWYKNFEFIFVISIKKSIKNNRFHLRTKKKV